MSTQTELFHSRSANISKFGKSFFHGINTFVQIRYVDKEKEKVLDVGFVEKVELNQFIDTNTESYIGMYGEPLFNSPSKVEYFGTIKKVLSDDVDYPNGRSDKVILNKEGYFTNAILNFNDGDAQGFGYQLLFDLIVYSMNNTQRMIIKAKNCNITTFKRIMKKDRFFIDEISFKFTKFEQKIQLRPEFS